MDKTPLRNRVNGRYSYEGNWSRLCVCGHLGVHAGETDSGKRPCFNSDKHCEGATGEPCNCQNFKKINLSQYKGKNVKITDTTGFEFSGKVNNIYGTKKNILDIELDKGNKKFMLSESFIKAIKTIKVLDAPKEI